MEPSDVPTESHPSKDPRGFPSQSPFALAAAVPLRKCHKEGGAAYRTRTCDPRITNAMLYQLS